MSNDEALKFTKYALASAYNTSQDARYLAAYDTLKETVREAEKYIDFGEENV